MKILYTLTGKDFDKSEKERKQYFPVKINNQIKEKKSGLVKTLLLYAVLGGVFGGSLYYSLNTNYEKPAKFIENFNGKDVYNLSFKKFTEKYKIPQNQITREVFEEKNKKENYKTK